MLANISDVFNGVMIDGDTVGETLFYGRGAGRNATASAVVADLVDVALNLKHNAAERILAFRPGSQFNELMPMDDVESRYYLRLQVKDEAGVVAKIADILSKQDISISSFIQREEHSEDNVPLLILTHEVKEKQINATINDFEKLSVVSGKVKIIRIEDI
jgi:homoserine dehydrogenase